MKKHINQLTFDWRETWTDNLGEAQQQIDLALRNRFPMFLLFAQFEMCEKFFRAIVSMWSVCVCVKRRIELGAIYIPGKRADSNNMFIAGVDPMFRGTRVELYGNIIKYWLICIHLIYNICIGLFIFISFIMGKTAILVM